MKRPRPVFALELALVVAGLAAPGDELPPSRPNGDEPPLPGVAGFDPPTAAVVPVARVLPNDDELLELPAAGFLSSAFAPPPKRPVMPPSKPPDFSVLDLVVAGFLSSAFAPPPKRDVRPPRLLEMPPSGLLLSPLALGAAGLSLLSLSPLPPKRPAIPPNIPPDFFSSGLAGLLAGFAGALLALEDGVLLAGRLAPNPPLELPEPPELPKPLLDPPKGDDPLLPAGRLGVDELPDPGEPGLLPAGRLPPN